MKESSLAVATAFIFIFIALIPAMGNSEVEMITTEDPETPLKGEPKYIETGQDGNLIFLSYQDNYGISIINRNDNTIEHITEPDIHSGSVHRIHYNEDDNVLFAVTGIGFDNRYTTLEIIWLDNDTIGKVMLNYYAPSVSDLEYNAFTNTLYLACADGLWIIDVDELEITEKLNKDTGLKSEGVWDLFQEPTENLLWFVTSWSKDNVNIQTLDMSTNTVSSEIFNVTDIAIRNGYTPQGPILTFIYDTTTRDIYVGFQFNKTITGEIFHLACFDRDDTSHFVPLPTGYLSEGKEVTRSDDYLGWKIFHINRMHSRNKNGVGPLFSGYGIGLFYIDPPIKKISTTDDELNIKTFTKTVRRPSVRFDKGTEKWVDIEVDYEEPEIERPNDVVVETDSTTATVSRSEGLYFYDLGDMVIPAKTMLKIKGGLFLAEYYKNESDAGKSLNMDKEKIETVKAEGYISILTKDFEGEDPLDSFFIGKSLLTITDSKGNVVYTHETGGREMEVEFQLSGLKSSEYTIRVERSDWIGNSIDYEECKFILDNPDQPSESESGSKLASAVLPIFGGLCGLLILGIIIAAILVFLNKKKID